jgi:hypothetical protein
MDASHELQKLVDADVRFSLTLERNGWFSIRIDNYLRQPFATHDSPTFELAVAALKRTAAAHVDIGIGVGEGCGRRRGGRGGREAAVGRRSARCPDAGWFFLGAGLNGAEFPATECSHLRLQLCDARF